MLTTRYKPALNRFFDPLAQVIARTGVSPSALTLAGPLLSGAVCAAFLRTHAIVPFCVAILLVGLLDALDGAVARVSGRVTRFGAYLDAVCDRYVEAIVVVTVAAVTGYWILSMVMLVGALLTSYTKARAAIEVPVTNSEWPDLMERTERVSVFLLGLFLSGLTRWRPFGHDLFWWALAVMAVFTHLTVIQRVFRARQLILERDGKKAGRP